MLPNVIVPTKRYSWRFFFIFLGLLTVFVISTAQAVTVADLRSDRGYTQFDYSKTLLDPGFDREVEGHFTTDCAGSQSFCWYKTVTCYVSTPFTGCIWYGFRWTLFPALELTLSYKEPTVFLETVSRRGHSMLDPLNETLMNAERVSEQGSGQAGNAVKNAQYYEAHVWGIGPQGRVDSSLSDEVAGETMACDIAQRLASLPAERAVWSITNDSRFAMPGLACPLDACNNPHRVFLAALQLLPGGIGTFLAGWQTMWFAASPDSITDVDDPLHLIFASEEEPDEWNPTINNDGSDNNSDSLAGLGVFDEDGMIEACEAIQSLRTLSGMLLLFADEVHFVPACIGSWGSLLPRNGWYTSTFNNMTTKALIGWRAYDRAITELPNINFNPIRGYRKYNPRSFYPETLVPEDTAGSIAAQGYYATQFNLEWPHHMTERRRIGSDVHEWSGLSKLDDSDDEDDYITESTPSTLMRLSEIQAYLNVGTELENIPNKILPKEDLTEADMVMTLWKDTECCVATCSNPYYYNPRWFVADGEDWSSPNRMWDVPGRISYPVLGRSYPWEITKFKAKK